MIEWLRKKVGSNSGEKADECFGEFRQPNWECEEAINDFLERGRRTQQTTPMYLNLMQIRTGYVTKAALDYYVIDHKVQYNRGGSNSDEHFNIGDFVRYTLDGNRCVRVERASVQNEQDDDGWDDRPSKNKDGVPSSLVKLNDKNALLDDLLSVVGKISAINSCRNNNSTSQSSRQQVVGSDWADELLVDIAGSERADKVTFNLNDVSVGGPVTKVGENNSYSCYRPMKDDWVRLTVSRVAASTEGVAAKEENRQNLGKVVAIEPLRWRNFEGEVNRIGRLSTMRSRSGDEFAIVEDEVFVPVPSACLNGYRPLRGEWVAGLAFECSAPEDCSWRAIDVFPRPQSSMKPRTGHSTTADTITSTVDDIILRNCEALAHIEVNGEIHFGQVLVSENKVELLSITNIGDVAETLLNVKLGESVCYDGEQSSKKLASSFDVDLDGLSLPLTISPKQRIDFPIRCSPKQIGFENQKIHFIFARPSNDEEEQEVAVSTYVEVEAVVEELLNLAHKPAVGSRRLNQGNSTASNSFRGENAPVVVRGQRPVFNTQPRAIFVPRLGDYEIPHKLRACLESREDIVSVCSYLAESLNMENYVKRFSSLLHMEEFAIQLELDAFSMSRVFFEPSTSYLAVKVPGLQDGRPSLLIGDRVIAVDPSPNNNSPVYEGFICEVRFADVLVSFSPTFQSEYNGEDYNVHFKFNRTPFRRCHQAIELAHLRLSQRVLFPSNSDLDLLKPSQQDVTMKTHTVNSSYRERMAKKVVNPCDYVPRLNLKFFNPMLNERQRVAVLRIVEGLARPIPYILYGPPGTGKTMTLVEVILQLYQLPDSRILACAPSNSAADLLCSRVHALYESQRAEGEVGLGMARLNAAQRSDAGMKDEVIQRYSKSLDDIDTAVKCRLIVSTCTTAGQMYRATLKNGSATVSVKAGSFTHVVIDEAGHATEPEALIAVNFVNCRNGQIVLAGDPQQLGPILESRLSNVYGLQVSLLERLSQLPVYSRDESRFSRVGTAGGYNPLVATKLVNNYRSHPSLFSVSSRLFYDDELVANAPMTIQNLFTSACASRSSDLLPNPDIPFILHAIQGRDLREGESMSWFNMHEVIQVIFYLRRLLDEFGDLVTADDIGIITPYRKQIEKLRLFMDRANLPYIKVGTVEEFQGQERSVIILSIVRSTESANVRQALGFLSNPKRMNVALTRAKSLLVVVANPFVLLADTYWAEFTRYAVSNRCCLGTDDVLAKIRDRLEKPN